MFLDLSNFSTLDATLLMYFLVKVLFLIGFGVYVIFAFVAARQIDNMGKTVITPLSPFVQLLGYLHLVLALAAFGFTFIFLQ